MPSPHDELVDVIDDAGQTIGVVTRAQMRRQRLPHRCVYILIFSQDGRLFIHQRTPTKDIYPGYWDVAVGGVLAAGESFDDGARREAQEELGVEPELSAIFPFRFADELTVVQAMVYRAVHNGPFHLQPDEVVRGEFIQLSELPGRLATQSFCPDGLSVHSRYQDWLAGSG